MKLLPYKTKQYLFVLLKVAIIVMAIYVVYNRLTATDLTLQNFWKTADDHNFLSISTILVIILFSVTNWILEILKWKCLAAAIRPLSFKEAMHQTLGAQTLAMITPGRLGEYGAKALFFPVEDRKKVVKLTFYHNMHQLAITVCLGVLGLCYLGKYSWAAVVIGLCAISYTGSVVLKKRVVKRYSLQQLWDAYLNLPKPTRNTNIVFSVARYLVFAHQYYLMLLIFGVQLHYVILMSIVAAVYLFASLLPVISLLDVVVKTGVAVYLLGLYHVPVREVLAVNLVMWLGNIAAPGLLGTYAVMRYNLKQKVSW